MGHLQCRGITVTQRSWRLSKALLKSMRRYWEKCLLIKSEASDEVEVTTSISQSPIDSAPWAATESDLERIAKFNLTEVPFPDQATLQQLVEPQNAQKLTETAVIY